MIRPGPVFSEHSFSRTYLVLVNVRIKRLNRPFERESVDEETRGHLLRHISTLPGPKGQPVARPTCLSLVFSVRSVGDNHRSITIKAREYERFPTGRTRPIADIPHDVVKPKLKWSLRSNERGLHAQCRNFKVVSFLA